MDELIQGPRQLLPPNEVPLTQRASEQDIDVHCTRSTLNPAARDGVRRNKGAMASGQNLSRTAIPGEQKIPFSPGAAPLITNSARNLTGYESVAARAFVFERVCPRSRSFQRISKFNPLARTLRGRRRKWMELG